MKEFLTPTIDDLRSEAVLVQAWKKTVLHLRRQSWYSDILGIDMESLRMPSFIKEVKRAIDRVDNWISSPLHIVPAPKEQHWEIKGTKWSPIASSSISKRIRPIAHVHLVDQVVATSIMMCLADRVEERLGDPRLSILEKENRNRVMAYGHRLFCDQTDRGLIHRWGSSRLYRQYFQDYQKFLERPRIVANQLESAIDSGQEVAICQSDLSNFYDRVSPELLQSNLSSYRRTPAEESFFSFASRVFRWKWADEKWAKSYGRINGIADYDTVTLPQGLVASGFFANVAVSSLVDRFLYNISTLD